MKILRNPVSILLLACLSAIPALPQAKTGDDTPSEAINGNALYNAYCASCHGTDGRGDGPVAKSLKVAPSDLTRIATRNGGAYPPERVARIIAGYDKAPGAHGSGDMPVWGPVFSRVESDKELGRRRIDAIARYLAQIQKP